MKKLDSKILNKIEELECEIASLHEEIYDRLTHILMYLFEFSNNTKPTGWWFDGVPKDADGECGKIDLNSDYQTIEFSVYRGKLKPLNILLSNRKHSFFGYLNSSRESSIEIPTRWFFEDFEEEVIKGKELYDKKQEAKNKKSLANKDNKSKLLKSAKDKLNKASLTKEEKAILGLKK